MYRETLSQAIRWLVEAHASWGEGEDASMASLHLRDQLEESTPDFGIRARLHDARDKRSEDNEGHSWCFSFDAGAGPRDRCLSLALKRDETPVLGVVYAPFAPDDQGDLIAWAEGEALTRGGVHTQRPPWRRSLGGAIIGVSPDTARRPAACADLIEPGRFVAIPGGLYRLALVAVGDLDAAVARTPLPQEGIIAVRALLKSQEGELVGARGLPLRPGGEATPPFFAGGSALTAQLGARDWDSVLRRQAEPLSASPPPPERVRDAALLSRAQGCWFGQLAGDDLGQLVEFQSEDEILRRYPKGPRRLTDGGTFGTLAGQPTDDSEMALVLARSLVSEGRYDAQKVAHGYALWLDSDPFDFGNTIAAALAPALEAIDQGEDAAEAARRSARTSSQANGALMRISPLAIFGHDLPEDALISLAREDAALTHPHPVCQDANALFVATLAEALRGRCDPHQLYHYALDLVARRGLRVEILETLEAAAHAPPDDFMHQMGWVLKALQNAFYQLLHAPNLEEGVIDTVKRGGDTDTNAAITGALLGALYGREAVPLQWRQAISSCRPIDGLQSVRRPRPDHLWPDDARWLSEALLAARGGATRLPASPVAIPKLRQGPTLEDAIAIALDAHRGQKDKAGEIYLLHPLRVMMTLREPLTRMTAVLHDVVEDSEMSLEALEHAGFPPKVIEALRLLTHAPAISYEDYIEAIAENPIAAAVKRADLRDNLNVTRLEEVDERGRARLNKYLGALRRLEGKRREGRGEREA